MKRQYISSRTCDIESEIKEGVVTTRNEYGLDFLIVYGLLLITILKKESIFNSTALLYPLIAFIIIGVLGKHFQLNPVMLFSEMLDRLIKTPAKILIFVILFINFNIVQPREILGIIVGIVMILFGYESEDDSLMKYALGFILAVVSAYQMNLLTF